MSENLALEKTLWQAAYKLRNNIDAAEYKHFVLGLLFLKYISDAFYDTMKTLYTQILKDNTVNKAIKLNLAKIEIEI